MRWGIGAAFLALAAVVWFAPAPDLWFLGLPLPEDVSLALAALAVAVWAWPWIRRNPLAAVLSVLVAAIVVVLTMATVTPLFVLAAAAAVTHWAVRGRTGALRRPRVGA